jgi:TPR repeat protein
LREQAATRIKAGDIPSARLILNRAYEHGDPLAALTLGETYDPVVLKRQNANTVSFYANVDEARKWYGRAADLGTADAVQRMKELAQFAR